VAGPSGARNSCEGVVADVGDRKQLTAAIDKCAKQRGGLGALLSGGTYVTRTLSRTISVRLI
jgi:hypothetical protein